MGPGRNFVVRHRTLLALLGTLVLVTLPFIEVLLGLKSAMWSDVNGTHVPRYITVWENLLHARSPFWWRQAFAGQNALGAGQSAVFYVPNAIFGVLSAVTAYRWWLLFHIWLMTAGFFIWSRHRWNSYAAAVVSGLAGGLNGFVIYHLVHTPFLIAMAWLPWVMILADLCTERRGVRYPALLAITIAQIGVCGQPQMLWLTLAALSLSSLTRLVRFHLDWRAVCRLVVGVGFGLGIAAAQLVPQARFSASSVRSQVTQDFVRDHALAPRHLLTLVSPGVMGGLNGLYGHSGQWRDVEIQHELANYVGVTLLALAVIGAWYSRRDRRTIGLLVIAAFGVATALAGHSPLGRVVYDVVPLAHSFRYWARNIVLLNVAVAVLAGRGVVEVLRRPQAWAKRVAGGAVALDLLMLVLPGITTLHGALLRGGSGAWVRTLPVLLLLGLALVLSLRVAKLWVTAALILAMCAFDLGAFATAAPWRSAALSPTNVQRLYSMSNPALGPIADSGGGVDRWINDSPWADDSRYIWDLVLPQRTPSAIGYDPLLQRDFSRVAGPLSEGGYPQTSDIWTGSWIPDVLRITTFYSSRSVPTRPAWSPIDGALLGFQRWRYTPRLDESYLIGSTRLTTLEDARVGLRDSTSRLTEFAYVESGTLRQRQIADFIDISTPGRSGQITDGGMDDGGFGRWTVVADRPSLFVTSYGWQQGWSARVDGRSVPVARTNGLVLGVPIPAGEHDVRLRFTPPGWTLGRNIALLAGGGVLLMLVGSTPTGGRLLRRFHARRRWSAPAPTS